MQNFSFIKGRGVFVVDLILIPVFMLVVYSGVELHAAGHGGDHHLWMQWAGVHIFAAVLSVVFIWMHVKAHWGWYKTLFRRGRSRATMILSVLFLAEAATGVVLLSFVEGGNSGVGLFHWAAGLALALFLLWHLVRRLPILLKGLRRTKKR